MGQECSGCTWIAEEIERRRSLVAQFERRGDHRFTQIATEGIASLARDWEAHRNCDHAQSLGRPLLALLDSINQQLDSTPLRV